MDTAKFLVAIGIILAIAGFGPWLADQRGYHMPPSLILWCGLVAIIAFAACLYYPFYPNLAAAIIVSFITGLAVTLWWIGPDKQVMVDQRSDLERQIVTWLYDLERPFVAKEQPNQDELFRIKVSLNTRVIYFSQQKNESKDLIVWTRFNVADADNVPNEKRTQLVLNIRGELSKLGISHENLNWPLQGVILSDLLTNQNTDRTHVLQALTKMQSALGLIESLAVPARASQ